MVIWRWWSTCWTMRTDETPSTRYGTQTRYREVGRWRPASCLRHGCCLLPPPPPPQVNSSGQTALHLASMNDHVEVVRALVAAGARVTVMDLARCTALDLR